MSIVEPTLLSLARASVIALTTLTVLLIGGPSIQSCPPKLRRFIFWMATAALLAPGFASAFVLQMRIADIGPLGRELPYGLVVWSRYALIPLLVVWLMPRSVSSEAMHCFRHSAAPWWRRPLWELAAWGRGLWLGTALVFLLAFQEFEIATTWNMRAWTVSLLDAQTGGLLLRESLRLALLPFLLQATLITALAAASRRESKPTELSGGLSERGTAAISPAMLSIVLCFAPMSLALSVTVRMLFAHGTEMLTVAPWREISNTLVLSISATILAWLLAGWIETRRGWRWLLALPGLLGPLLCGLLLLTALQVPPLYLMRDTVFPTVLGLTLVLLPFALLLRFGIETTRDLSALHIARSTGGSRATWQLDGWPRLCAILMLFCFGYGDFTINSLLAPPQFTSVSVRLLNLLHYGRSSALVAMFIIAFAVPLAAALLTALIARLYPRRRAS